MSALNFKQFFHIWTQQLLDWLTVKFNSIDIDTSDLAKEAKATSNKNEILSKIENTQPDLSTVAKQGSNSNTSLTVVDNKIDDFYDTFDADIALQLQGIIGDTEESVSDTSQTAIQVEELRTLQESYDELADKTADSQEILTKVQSIIDAHVINGFNYGDVVFNNYAPISFIDAYMHLGNIIEINDYSIYTFSVSSSPLMRIPRINLYNVEYIGATSVLQGSWVYLNMPKLRTLGRTYGSNSSTAQELHIPELAEWQGDHGGTFDQSSPDLILIEFGAKLTSSCNVFATWNPINALSSISTSLIKPGETFASNLEKFLYNMRTYIAANLPDRTGLSALTITFSAAVKAAILADTDTANAFADKNWTVS